MSATEQAKAGRRGESRWPSAIAVLTTAVLAVLIPDDFRLTTWSNYVYAGLLLVFLVVIIVGDPGRIDRETRWVRNVTGAMIATVTLSTAFSAGRVVAGILQHSAFTSPGQLLALGGIVLITNMIAFALWFWHMDAGGPVARSQGRSEPRRAFVFPEASLPELEGAGWYPTFVDYFALSFNTSTAFSPTDVSAVRRWAKMLMICESTVSLTLVVLVVARAVNVL